MGTFIPDSASIASSIKYHAEFTPSFSTERFELPKAFFATAESVRDNLIINWNVTYDYYEKMNVKQAYYLSMEFLQVCPGFLFVPAIKMKFLFACYLFVRNFIYLFFQLLQGSALLNAIGNLELSGAYAEALRKLGHDLEDVARQVR